ncbi:MAG: hypothetical protein ACXV2D_08825, partial [Halobacteriota archaeon]
STGPFITGTLRATRCFFVGPRYPCSDREGYNLKEIVYLVLRWVTIRLIHDASRGNAVVASTQNKDESAV